MMLSLVMMALSVPLTINSAGRLEEREGLKETERQVDINYAEMVLQQSVYLRAAVSKLTMVLSGTQSWCCTTAVIVTCVRVADW